mmetsp:Transcript_45535/g.135809  ORF Transcript_45535/g.135809 Transcript_45535/m.135809 type:complete len:245 (-) Transcript_45535:795-1529(-)
MLRPRTHTRSPPVFSHVRVLLPRHSPASASRQDVVRRTCARTRSASSWRRSTLGVPSMPRPLPLRNGRSAPSSPSADERLLTRHSRSTPSSSAGSGHTAALSASTQMTSPFEFLHESVRLLGHAVAFSGSKQPSCFGAGHSQPTWSSSAGAGQSVRMRPWTHTWSPAVFSHVRVLLPGHATRSASASRQALSALSPRLFVRLPRSAWLSRSPRWADALASTAGAANSSNSRVGTPRKTLSEHIS